MGSLRTLTGVLAVLRLTDKQLASLREDPQRHWQVRTIQARGKSREIRIPSRLLRTAHQRLLKGPLRSVPIHAASYCERGKGGLAAARLHAKHPVLLHLDLKGFFPSVSPERVQEELQRVRFDGGAAQLIAELTTVDDQLPQGASTSVALGNLVLGRLDGRIAKLSVSRGLTYTRYVDDLGISGGKRLADAENLIRRIVAEEGWTIGNGKGGLLGVDRRHKYLGVLVNVAPNIDSTYIKDLRFLISSIAQQDTAPSKRLLERVWGQLDWISAVNPVRGRRLEAAAIQSGIGRPRP